MENVVAFALWLKKWAKCRIYYAIELFDKGVAMDYFQVDATIVIGSSTEPIWRGSIYYNEV